MNLLRRAIIQATGGSFNLAENFATTLYTGNGSTQDIVTNLDSTTKEGLFWAKGRTTTASHYLVDTLRGAGKLLSSDSTNAEATNLNVVSSFNSDGVSVGSSSTLNTNLASYVAWQFMKAQGFFDIVEYVGDGTASNTIPHSLGVEVGHIIWKNRDTVSNWRNYHRTLGSAGSLELNTTASNQGSILPSTPTTSDFTVGSNTSINGAGDNYITYLFAHNPSKGIYCGSYTGTGAAGNKQTTGFPVGWVLIKRADSAGNWVLYDVPRSDEILYPNLTNAGGATGGFVLFDSDGFTVDTVNADHNSAGGDYIYVAIRDPSVI